jgi:hypothetical protein
MRKPRADLEQQLEKYKRELAEALEQQTATSEVLKLVSHSAFDLQPVLDNVLQNAVRLCSADKGLIYRQDGGVYRIAVSYGHSPEWIEIMKRYPIRQDRGSATGRAILALIRRSGMAAPQAHRKQATYIPIISAVQSASAECSHGPRGQSVGQAAQFCLERKTRRTRRNSLKGGSPQKQRTVFSRLSAWADEIKVFYRAAPYRDSPSLLGTSEVQQSKQDT